MAGNPGSLKPEGAVDPQPEAGHALHCIIAAIDLGARSNKALMRACRIAARSGASLRIIHAAPTPLDHSRQAAFRVNVRKQVCQIVKDVSDLEVDFSVHMLDGHPEEVISREAERTKADLVIIGGHGEPRFRDTIFGITASHILQRLAVPLLVAQREGGDYQRVMAASDNDIFAADLARFALQIAPGAEIHVVQAVETGGSAFIENAAAGEKRRYDREHNLQQALARALGPGTAPERLFTCVEEGDPMEVIERCSDRLQPDLIAMGTHGCMGMERLIQGSFAEYVLLWASADVLVLPVGWKAT
ncbi:universal stress protein [Allosphingosinicella vermicomposti]|uniref:universal stress protein n=1 Tax=Allosphingosinicella vermicomposti TaxID=614671 RepID=UPI00131A54B7|nr:universal stress protein [Allosphingosinicella vermicomposti]